jgi:probable HAF family extracellular repeat protein
MKCSVALALLVWGSCQVSRADPVGYSFTTFDVPGAIATIASDINDVGQIVGAYTTDTVTHGFLYSGGTFTTIDMPPLGPTFEPVDTSLSGINNAGQIVGSLYQPSFYVGYVENSTRRQYGFVLDSNGMAVLERLGSPVYEANGINNLGQIVGSFFDSTGEHGFIDTNGVFTTIDFPRASRTHVAAINNLGQIVGGIDGRAGFLETNGVFQPILFPGKNTDLYDINDAGDIIGDSVSGGVLNSLGEFTPINFPGSQETLVFGINNAGQIVGTFFDSSNRGHGFIATPIPEATSMLLVVLGLAFVAIWTRLRRSPVELPESPHAGYC